MKDQQTKPTNPKKLLTIYGRKTVFEALADKHIQCSKLHLAESNKPADILRNIIQLAKQRDIPIRSHNKISLSFISKNSKQDQGVALDITLPKALELDQLPKNRHIILLDQITNPQNLGMIIRTVTASSIGALIIPTKGCAELGPLCIKASVGSIFKAPIIKVNQLSEVIATIKKSHHLTTLRLDAQNNFYQTPFNKPHAFVFGNETNGVSDVIEKEADLAIKIPMHNGVESLNVAVTAGIIAFHPAINQGG